MDLKSKTDKELQELQEEIGDIIFNTEQDMREVQEEIERRSSKYKEQKGGTND